MSGEETHALSLSDKIKEALSFRTMFTLRIADFELPITETVVTTWIVMAILIGASLFFTRRMKDVPGRGQLMLELIVGGLNGFFRDQIGHRWKTFAPWLGTVALYLAIANLIPMFSPIAGFGFVPPFTLKPPTRDINVSAAVAILTIVIVLISGIAFKGIKGWLASFLKPVPFMLPFNIIEYAIKPMSLCLRLFGNILGAFIIMEILATVVPLFVPPVASLYFDIFDGLVQAAVFTFLSTLYISEAVEEH